jgi:hypothetical protein
MTLYKHGVGFFERRATVSGKKVELSFRVEEMNDILKSLTAIDWGGGQVLGIDYATPQSREERLAGCSIRLDDDRSLQDLLVSLRGRRVTLHLDQGETTTGTLVGLDDPPERQPLDSALVSLLRDQKVAGAEALVQTAPLARVQGVEILDDQGAGDLRFFLQTALSQEAFRSVTIRLTPGKHELSVSYIAPAPTWRVSYRLVAEPNEGEADQDPQPKETGTALLQGWGIFDNQLEEDLESISLALVAGMPISFVYDLYTPFTPERPVVEEEARVAAAPVGFGAEMEEALGAVPAAPAPAMQSRARADVAKMRAMTGKREVSIADMEKAAAVKTESAELGELFQYKISTPVTVSRGHSAMVPILQSKVAYTKDLIYNGQKMATHPVATLRLQNTSGLTLERGPVTVIESSEYVGEAVLPFTVVGAKMVIPYAVELGVKVREDSGFKRETQGLTIKGAYLQFEMWEVRWRTYQVTNTTAQSLDVLIEHPRSAHYDLVDTPEPTERTDDAWRFAVTAPAQGEVTLKAQERRLTYRREEIQRQSFDGLKRYLKQGLLKAREVDRLNKLLTMWEDLARHQAKLKEIAAEREKIYKAQEQIQGNMKALGQTGKEGALRARYVERLEESEAQLRDLERQEAEIKAEIQQLQKDINQALEHL